MSNTQRIVAGFVIALILVAAAIGVAVRMVKSRPQGKKSSRPETVAAVRVTTPRPADDVTHVHAAGTVEASRTVSLTPEVKGRVVFVSDDLVEGGVVKKGQVLLRVDARDYKIAVEQERSRVQQAELNLTTELSRQRIAKEEWELLGDKRPEEQAALALRKPQLANAEAQLRSAESGLRRAELNLERTVIRAPFNGVVVNETVEVGQLVGQQAVVTIVGTDQFWVTVSVPLDRLATLSISDDGNGSKAGVHLRLPDESVVEYEGRALRLRGQLDPQTRTAQLVVGVNNPMAEIHKMPLLLNSYVDVVLEGKPIEGGLRVPRVALKRGNAVWTVDANDQLRRKELQVVFKEPNDVVVTAGLDADSRVVTSPMALPIDGMKVRVLQDAVANGVEGAAATKGGE